MSRLFLSLISLLRVYSQGAADILGTGASGTQGTGTTVLDVEGEHHIRRPTCCLALGVVRTRFAVGAYRALSVPVDRELGVVKGIFRSRLPALMTWHWPDEINPLLLALDEQVDLHVARIDQVRIWQQVPSG